MSLNILGIALIGTGLVLASQKAAGPQLAQQTPIKNLLKITNLQTDYAAMYSEIRGLRNNNAGNIRHGANWQGLAANQSDPSFAVFESPEWGIRAMAKVLLNYQRLYGLNTVSGIIDRWAPPIENNTGAYQAHVAKLMGVGVDEPIQVRDHLLTLVKAIIKHENGIQPYSEQLIKDGLALV